MEQLARRRRSRPTLHYPLVRRDLMARQQHKPPPVFANRVVLPLRQLDPLEAAIIAALTDDGEAGARCRRAVGQLHDPLVDDP